MRDGVRALHPVWIAAAAVAVAMGACSSTGAKREEHRSAEAVCEAAGEPEACAAAAELYFDGKNGHPLDHERSFRYASAACDKGHAFACALVGYHHQDGLGTEWAPERAIADYEKACAGGAGVGCYNLATMYSGGQGVVADDARAEQYKVKAKAAWEAACRGSAPRWCTNVAYLLREEKPVDRQRVLELDQRSCDHQVLVGCTEAARDRFAMGTMGAAPLLAELERLCRAGEPTACTLAGTLFIAGGEGITSDPRRGMTLVVHGCEIGDKEACKAAGLEYAKGELVPMDLAAADRFVILACDHGLGSACDSMARDRGAKGQFAQQAGFARRACQMGQAESCASLSQLYFSGQGVARSKVDGLRWATEGCRMGYPPSCGPLIEENSELPIPPRMKERVYRDACAAGIANACSHQGAAGGSIAAPPI